MISLHPFKAVRGIRAVALTVALLGLTSGKGFSQEAPKRELSDKVSEALGNLRTLNESKNYDGVLAVINGLLPAVVPNSYDQAILLQIKAQTLLQKDDFPGAIPPLEKTLQLGDTYNFFEEKVRLEFVYLLAQIHYQEASQSKDKVKQAAEFEKAYSYVDRWLKQSPKENPDIRLFAASVLYSQATLDPEKVNLDKVRQALAEAQKGLMSSVKPKDQFYVLALASVQQLGEQQKAADYLELLVKNFPDNKNYWQQLAATYLQIAGDTKDEGEVFRNNLRSILTIERAQARGIMTTPKDYFNLIGLYFNIQQYDRAIDLLEKGLKSGQVENEKRNWELLATSYQQLRKEFKAIETLKQATALFPKDGQLEFSIAQIYYGLDKNNDAYRHLQDAVKKGNLDKPGTVYLFMAYIAYELQKYDDAKKWITDAASSKDTKKEDVERLRRVIDEALKEREFLKEEPKK